MYLTLKWKVSWWEVVPWSSWRIWGPPTTLLQNPLIPIHLRISNGKQSSLEFYYMIEKTLCWHNLGAWLHFFSTNGKEPNCVLQNSALKVVLGRVKWRARLGGRRGVRAIKEKQLECYCVLSWQSSTDRRTTVSLRTTAHTHTHPHTINHDEYEQYYTEAGFD